MSYPRASDIPKEFLVILAVIALSALVPGNDPTGAAVLMQQVARQTEEYARLRTVRGLTYGKDLVVRDVKDEEHPVLQETRSWTVRAVGAGTASRLTVKNGRPVAEPEKPDFDLLDAMRTRFRFRWADEPETSDEDGRCFNVVFEPIDMNAKAATVEEQIINHLTGTVCIDVERFFVRRIEAHLQKQFRIRVFACMKRVHLTIDQTLVEGLPVYLRSRTELHFSKFGFDSVKQLDMTYRDWQYAVPAPAP